MEQGLLGRLCPVADSVEGGWAIWPPPPIGAGNGPTKLLGEQLVHPAPPFFLPRDASAERGNATVSRPSVCLSVCDV